MKFHILSVAIITKQPGLCIAQQLQLLNGFKSNPTSSESVTEFGGYNGRGNFGMESTTEVVRTVTTHADAGGGLCPCMALGDTSTREAQRKNHMKGITRMVTDIGKTL